MASLSNLFKKVPRMRNVKPYSYIVKKYFYYQVNKTVRIILENIYNNQ